MTCLIHRDEGVFYIPDFWKECPVCYDSGNAIFIKGVRRKSSVKLIEDLVNNFLENRLIC